MYQLLEPGKFEQDNHFYAKVVNSQIHPLVRHFFDCPHDRIMNRFCHLNPSVDRKRLAKILSYRCKYFRWAGTDLINVTPQAGHKQMVVIETNSCPSGQKSMPLRNDLDEQGGYRQLVEYAFGPLIDNKADATIGVIFDKNEMEARGYACALADYLGRPVHLMSFYENEPAGRLRYQDGFMEIRGEKRWHRLTHCLRYVTQRPWNRIPVDCETKIFNPIVACLAGGRNKLVASKAYELFNAELMGSGIRLKTPHTVHDVSKGEIPLVIQSLGGFGVIKIPYSNAGQGVFTITSNAELEKFMEQDIPYEQYIVQSLIGNIGWSSVGAQGQLYHVGMIPDKKNDIYVYDLRFMICNGENGFLPLAIYCRRSRDPLSDTIEEGADSWSMLGTNLSIKLEKGWDSDTKRLLIMDTKDFNKLGLGFDDLVEAFVQSVLAITAIDRMACNLITKSGKLKRKLFSSLNRDETLLKELMQVNDSPSR